MKNFFDYMKTHPMTCFIEGIIGIALFGIICAIIGFHGTTEFNLWWFLLFECPLYVFIIWTFVWIFKMVKNIFEMEENKNNK